MSVPSRIHASETVRLFVEVQGVKLTEQQIRQLVDLADTIWNNPSKVYFMTECHRAIYTPSPGAGEYRGSALLSNYVRVRDYPRSATVSLLMERFFQPAYRNALEGDISKSEHSRADIAWFIGALGRCIHPFLEGNLVIFWLIENQIRLVYGLPLTIEIRPKLLFDTFRLEQFKPLAQDFYRPPGT